MRFLVPRSVLVLALFAALQLFGCATPPPPSGEPPATYDFTVKLDWLTMPDGVPLSVTYWMPVAKTPSEKFPVVLEMLPYHKDDDLYQRDHGIYAYLAHRGIVGARVDIRGTGSSYGVTPDREYSDAELNDIVSSIALLAQQPWSNGNVGMMGGSWSAFNALMMTMRRPPALKGIFVFHGSEDLYANDIHNIDGGLHIDPQYLDMELENIVPRSPDYVLNAAYFADRFDQTPWIFSYLHHQRDGDFWQNGRSLQTDYDAVNIPVFVIGGLLDGYRDYVIGMLDHVHSVIKAEISPENHTGGPGPHHEWRDIAVRWWQQVLQGHDTTIMDWPKLLVFMRGSVPPDEDLQETPGSYWAVDWPVTNTRWMHLLPQRDSALTEAPEPPGEVSLAYRPSAGVGVLNWWGETTPDMRPADQDALVFNSAPMTQPVQILGQPKVVLRVSASAKLADWIVRLEDVNPDGSVSFITGALRNGTQRFSRTNPQAIVPGQKFELAFPLHFTTWTFAPGHRIRMVVTNAQFPMIWPTPYKMTTKLMVGDGATAIDLPVASPSALPMPALLPTQPSEPRPGRRELGPSDLQPGPFKFERDASGHVTATAHEGTSYEVNGTTVATNYRTVFELDDRNPAAMEYRAEGKYDIKHDGRDMVMSQVTLIRSDARYFHVSVVRRAIQDGVELKSREWREDIPRDLQ